MRLKPLVVVHETWSELSSSPRKGAWKQKEPCQASEPSGDSEDPSTTDGAQVPPGPNPYFYVSPQPVLEVPRSLAAGMGSVTAMAHGGAPACVCVRQAMVAPSAPSVETATTKLPATTVTWYVRVCRVPTLGWAGLGGRVWGGQPLLPLPGWHWLATSLRGIYPLSSFS